jgi:hypothetical protein
VGRRETRRFRAKALLSHSEPQLEVTRRKEEAERDTKFNQGTSNAETILFLAKKKMNFCLIKCEFGSISVIEVNV